MKTMLLIIALVTVTNMAKAANTSIESFENCMSEQREIIEENADGKESEELSIEEQEALAICKDEQLNEGK